MVTRATRPRRRWSLDRPAVPPPNGCAIPLRRRLPMTLSRNVALLAILALAACNKTAATDNASTTTSAAVEAPPAPPATVTESDTADETTPVTAPAPPPPQVENPGPPPRAQQRLDARRLALRWRSVRVEQRPLGRSASGIRAVAGQVGPDQRKVGEAPGAMGEGRWRCRTAPRRAAPDGAHGTAPSRRRARAAGPAARRASLIRARDQRSGRRCRA